MKTMKGLSMNKMLGSMKRKPTLRTCNHTVYDIIANACAGTQEDHRTARPKTQAQ
jgi:hypothetical protein